MTRPMSVIFGKDKEIIPVLLEMHSPVANPRILDCTYNKGVMWKGLDYKPTRMDIDPSFELDVVGDFKAMPFEAASFDVVVYDPPHLPTNAASENSSKIWEKRYGLTAEGEGREGDNVSGMFEPFLKEAKRVLVPHGIVLAKIADLTHNHRYQWQHLDLVFDAQKLGMTACDMIIKVDPNGGKLASSKWENIKHVRKCHCYWIVVRNSLRCEAPIRRSI